jgi:hypothetical protein
MIYSAPIAALIRVAGTACKPEGLESSRLASECYPLHVCCLTDRASAAATSQPRHYPTFLRSEASASCMRLLGGAVQGIH